MKTAVTIFILLIVPFFGMSNGLEKLNIDYDEATASLGDIRVSEGYMSPPPPNLFITKWVVLGGETITIPTIGSGYLYDVDWSYNEIDGFNAESSNVTGNTTSPVLTAGEHIVAISGTFPRIYFNDTGDKDKITEVVQWGSNPWTSMRKAFQGCSNLNITNPAVGVPNLSSVTDMKRMFAKASSFNGAIGDWDVSNVSDMTRMFRLANSFDQNLADWDIGSVTTMQNMLLDAGLSTSNYDNTLIGWATDSSGTPGDGMDDIPTGIIFNGGTSNYCASETARDLLTAALPTPTGYGWTITDAGSDCSGLFITKWVVLGGETITIPTTETGYNYNVDWSYVEVDGFNAESTNVTGDATSPVLTAGEHIVAISGDFPRIYFNSEGDRDKITEIVQWGTNPWTTMLKAFEGCSNLNITNPSAGVPNLSALTSLKRMFYKAYAFNGTVSNWDVSNVTDMTAMFRRAYAFNQNLGGWDISNVTNMEIMFFDSVLSSTNYNNTLIGWATDSSGVAGDGIDDIPTNITFDGGTSRYCSGETARNLLTAALPSPTGYGWTITDGGLDCGGTSSLFLTKWEVLAGETITIPTKGAGYNYIVDWSFNEFDGFNAEAFNVTGDITSSPLAAGEYTVAIRGDFPRIYFNDAGDKDKITEIVQWGTNPWTSMVDAFSGCSNLNITDPGVGTPVLSTVTSTARMFNGASSFNSAIGDWDVSNVTDMTGMFRKAQAFDQSLDAWDVSNVITMRRMFYQATAFNSSLSWDVSNVENMESMFFKATAFDQDLGAWDIGSATTMVNMFFDVALSTSNYDNTLIGWAIDDSGTPGDGTDDIPTNIIFNGGISTYCAGETARNLLTAALPTPTGYGWTITDGGMICPPVLGVNDSKLESVTLYPNPTQNVVSVVSPQTMVISATVYDVQGRKVSEVDFRNQTNYQVDLSTMEIGVYLINITTEIGTVTKRAIKKQ